MPKQPKDFSQAKVYKIVCNTTQEIYVGSTTKQYLSQRLASHRKSFKDWKKGTYGFVSSYPIMERGNYTIELIEACPCQCWDELLAREGFWIKELDCVNQRVPGRTREEYRHDNAEKLKTISKAYREANPEREKERSKAYREANPEKIKEIGKAYYEEKTEEIKEKVRLYRASNLEKISEQKKAYHEAHREELLEKKKAYYQANKVAIKAKNQAYREAKEAAQ